jgi:nitrogen regulation protein NR(I)
MAKLLVVDDEPAILQLFRRKYEQDGIEVVTASTAEEGIQAVQNEQPDVAIFDIVLPDRTGIEAFEEIQRIDPKLPVIFMTALGASETAIEAMTLGALDFLIKPLDFTEVRRVIEQALEIRRFMNEPVSLHMAETTSDSTTKGDTLVGRCPAMQLVYKSIGRVAEKNVTVLIRGESGTGKELVARALYQYSKRREGPFMEVNSAAIPDALLESELFGHEKGAFTGADRTRVGKFEQCNGGTIFLDEIGDMPPTLQSKMLRVLQEQRFERVGGNQTIQTDVRVIAATNRDLEKMVAENLFRSDLYYRLNGFTINLPTLHERGDDLLPLIDHFIRRANEDLGKQIHGVAPSALDALKRYSWPGNIRELQNVIRQAVVQSTGAVLLFDFLPGVVTNAATHETVDPPAESPANFWEQFVTSHINQGSANLYDEAVTTVDREIISRVLRHTGGNQVEAAKILGMTRTTLRSKIKQAGISIDRVVSGGNDTEN